jgi:hypothetical protein
VLADLASGLGEGGVEVRAEVDELRLLVGEQRPDDDQDRAADRDDRPLLETAPGDASVALAEEGVGAGHGPAGRCLTSCALTSQVSNHPGHPSSASQSPSPSNAAVILETVRTSCIRAGRAGHPDAAHHLGLAHIQCGDPFDDLVPLGFDLHRSRLRPFVPAGEVTRGSCRER